MPFLASLCLLSPAIPTHTSVRAGEFSLGRLARGFFRVSGRKACGADSHFVGVKVRALDKSTFLNRF